MAIVIVRDAIHANVGHLPPGHAAGYTTGSPDIVWTVHDWDAHPGAVRICQDSAASDLTADCLDVERGAASNGQAAHWYRMAHRSYAAGTRPGQRWPAIYTSASNVTALTDSLMAGGVRSGPRLWVAKWDFNSADDIQAINTAGGPFPIIGGQFADGTPSRPWDTSVFSSNWLGDVSTAPIAKPPAAPQRFEADGHQSWRELAHAHGATVARSLWLTAMNEPNGFGQPRQAAYIAAGDWNAVLPAGVAIWVG